MFSFCKIQPLPSVDKELKGEGFECREFAVDPSAFTLNVFIKCPLESDIRFWGLLNVWFLLAIVRWQGLKFQVYKDEVGLSPWATRCLQQLCLHHKMHLKVSHERCCY